MQIAVKSISSEQLASTLNSQFFQCYLLTGNDPLLSFEAQEQIIKVVQAQDFGEKFTAEINNTTNWEEIFDQTQSQGLFSQRLILQLVLPETLSVSLQKNLAQLMEMLHEDVILIVHAPKFSKIQEKQAWFQSLKQHSSLIINTQTPKPEHLAQWLRLRSQAMQLSLDEEAVRMLCFSYEGNLLALKQTLDLLSLLYPDGKLNLMRVQKVVEQSAVFTVFQWVDALLMGNFLRAKYILQTLEQEELSPIILIRTVQKELVTLLKLTQIDTAVKLDIPLATANLRSKFDELKIWQARRDLYINTIHRLSYRQLFGLIQKLAQLERASKQDFEQNLWLQLMEFSQKMCLS